MNTTNTRSNRRVRSSSGFSLIEVLIAVVVLSVGLLALAALQARLARSGAESKVQTMALSLAQERVEELRNFATRVGYQALTSEAPVVLDLDGSGSSFSRSVTVTRHVWNPATQTFVQAASNTDAAVVREFKQVAVQVGWTDADGQGRSIVLQDIVSSTSPGDSALTLRDNDHVKRQPRVHIYTPSEAGIIPIAIGDNLAAASSNPKPELSRRGTSTLTQFNVQTYRTETSNPLLQRRIDFAIMNCDCRLGGTSTNANPAFEPTYWNGTRYVPPKRVPADAADTATRPIAQSVTNLMNSELFEENICTSCCRDHHDPATATTKADPFRPRNDYSGGNHNHYPDIFPIPEDVVANPITGTGIYHEVCRLVRVDGIYRVATDTRMENLTILRMEGSSNPILAQTTIDDYAAFAKEFVEAAWSNYSATPPTDETQPYNQFPSPNRLLGCTMDEVGVETCESPLTALGVRYQNKILDMAGTSTMERLSVTNIAPKWLASRGLYIDYLSEEAREALACIGNTTDLKCRNFKDSSVLELVPFVAVNMTNLASFGPFGSTIVNVRSDPLSNDPYVRGRVTARGNGIRDVFTTSWSSNASLVDQSPTNPADAGRLMRDNEYGVILRSDEPPLPRFGMQIVPNPSNLSNFARNNVLVQVTAPEVPEPICSRGAGGNRDRHACTYTDTAMSVTVRFSNYNACPNNYDWTGTQCVNSRDQVVAVNDFKLCRIRDLPAGVTASVVTYTSLGLPHETASVTLSALAPLRQLGFSAAAMKAIFAAQSGTCPTT
jgi:type IV pilus modification protein PilV